MALSRDGIMLMVPPRMATEKDKDDFSNAARMLTVGYGARSWVRVSNTRRSLCRVVA
jgi:hypothetical protein